MIGTLRTVALDTPDHRALARFYTDLLGGDLVDADDEWATVTVPNGWRLGFQFAPDHVQPRWPDPAAPQQMHLDMQVPDIDAAAKRAEQLGASRLGGGATWHVMADPSGHPFCLAAAEMEEEIRLFGVNIDCADPVALAGFWAEVLGLPVRYEAAEGAWVGPEDRPTSQILFQAVADYRPPRWPDPSAPQQLHLDIHVDDPDAAEPRVLAAGATRLPGEGEDWRVFADPSGHPFCLVF
jgi:predicted enzyme related to lactoylglutathione lyase